MTLKPIEATTPLDEEAINPELVKAIRWAKQSGPVMTPAEFKSWLDRYEARNRQASVLRVLGCGVTVNRLPPSTIHAGCDSFLALLLRVLASQTRVQQFILHGSQGLLSFACLARRSPSSFQGLIFC